MDRSAALNAAIAAVADRPNQYGKPEQNFDRIAALWNAHFGNNDNTSESGDIYVEATDVAIMLALVKIARLEADPTHADSWIDLAGYAGCGAEVSGAGNSKPDAFTEALYGDNASPFNSSGLVKGAYSARVSDLVDDVAQHARPPWGLAESGMPPISSYSWTGRHPESKFGFTVGETVNLKSDPIGYRPGKVIAFRGAPEVATIFVRWSNPEGSAYFPPDSLRHGA